MLLLLLKFGLEQGEAQGFVGERRRTGICYSRGAGAESLTRATPDVILIT